MIRVLITPSHQLFEEQRPVGPHVECSVEIERTEWIVIGPHGK